MSKDAFVTKRLEIRLQERALDRSVRGGAESDRIHETLVELTRQAARIAPQSDRGAAAALRVAAIIAIDCDWPDLSPEEASDSVKDIARRVRRGRHATTDLTVLRRLLAQATDAAKLPVGPVDEYDAQWITLNAASFVESLRPAISWLARAKLIATR